jgi:4-hydroxy-tetrahydrodipicolinate reductase
MIVQNRISSVEKFSGADMKPKLIISGAAGRMGRRIIAIAGELDWFEIVGAVENSGHPDLGKDAGLLAGTAKLGVEITDTFSDGAAVVIDFSQPQAADGTMDYCQKTGTRLVMGTTGLSSDQQEKIARIAEKLPVVYATNMSVGMNVLFALVGKAAEMLGEQYDIEIVEHHHRFKKDSPSGSALTLAENICKATGRDYPGCLTHGRQGKEALRKEGNIGMHSVRAGDIAGFHSVMYSTLGESVTLSHNAHTRDGFARGALRAAKWLVSKEPGLYSMADVLGIKY